LLADSGERKRLVDSGVIHASRFTWESSARQHAAIYAESLAV
ncbi:MAG: hypothetical protein QOC66_4127, partial [Pseudonocardiales bacterium]|nr:hypothetical protein [Pseudonocardiales bacterium]